MKLLILDGNSVINRAYFGVKPLTTREAGTPQAPHRLRGVAVGPADDWKIVYKHCQHLFSWQQTITFV